MNIPFYFRCRQRGSCELTFIFSENQRWKDGNTTILFSRESQFLSHPLNFNWSRSPALFALPSSRSQRTFLPRYEQIRFYRSVPTSVKHQFARIQLDGKFETMVQGNRVNPFNGNVRQHVGTTKATKITPHSMGVRCGHMKSICWREWFSKATRSGGFHGDRPKFELGVPASVI